ncbi:unnamed protein product, partial [Callosobruchus maculatus]
ITYCTNYFVLPFEAGGHWIVFHSYKAGKSSTGVLQMINMWLHHDVVTKNVRKTKFIPIP